MSDFYQKHRKFQNVILYDASGNPITTNTITDRTDNLDGDTAVVTQSQIYGSGSDSLVQPIRIDKFTNTLQVIDYAHHEAHAASHYFVRNYEDQANGAYLDIRVTTPDTTKWAHMLLIIEVESEVEVMVYEGAVISVAGTARTPINNNRNSANTSGLAFDYIVNTSLANADADTDVSGATLLEDYIVGSGRDSGSASRDQEIILDQNRIYDVRILNNAAGYVNYFFSWYEHTDANAL